MNWLKRSLLVVAGMLSFCGSDAPAADAPVKVYILAGQSNMQGHAKVSTLAYMAEDPATAGLLSQMQDGEGAFARWKTPGSRISRRAADLRAARVLAH